ncbi:MAG: hypothetical protein ACI4VW_03990 [Acutalibacteraceae bacterium]
MIGIKVEKAHGEYDPGTSKFFGAPTMPEEWLTDGTVRDDDFFFCQLKLSEFKKFDGNVLSDKTGFIYIFLTQNGEDYTPNVRYCENEPETLIDDFNAGFEIFDEIETDFSIDFFETPDASDGTRILIEKGEEITLLQYDPLDSNMPEFLADTEKIACFKMKTSDLKNLDFSNVKFTIE